MPWARKLCESRVGHWWAAQTPLPLLRQCFDDVVPLTSFHGPYPPACPSLSSGHPGFPREPPRILHASTDHTCRLPACTTARQLVSAPAPAQRKRGPAAHEQATLSPLQATYRACSASHHRRVVRLKCCTGACSEAALGVGFGTRCGTDRGGAPVEYDFAKPVAGLPVPAILGRGGGSRAVQGDHGFPAA
jgi:hypothetical protein